jgi:hypothetical protein
MPNLGEKAAQMIEKRTKNYFLSRLYCIRRLISLHMQHCAAYEQNASINFSQIVNLSDVERLSWAIILEDDFSIVVLDLLEELHLG